MAGVHRWILVASLLALVAGSGFAQINGGGGGTALTCAATSSAPGTLLRSESFNELIGDILVQCSGGSALSLGSTIPQVDVTVNLNTGITSRILGNGNQTFSSEALLLIDEPNTGLSGYGPSVPQTLCANPGGGCQQWVGNSTVAGGNGVPVASNPNTGIQGSFNPSPVAPGANVFQGVVSLDGQSVTFHGVPLLAPVSAGALRVFRITNIRADAEALTFRSSPGIPASVSALVSVECLRVQQPVDRWIGDPGSQPQSSQLRQHRGTSGHRRAVQPLLHHDQRRGGHTRGSSSFHLGFRHCLQDTRSGRHRR